MEDFMQTQDAYAGSMFVLLVGWCHLLKNFHDCRKSLVDTHINTLYFLDHTLCLCSVS